MEQTLALPYGTLVWDDLGPRHDALPLVLLHGFPHDRGFWAALVADREALGDVRLLIPDLPGFGQSSPLAEPSMDGYADAVAALMDEAGIERAVIGGLSMGGYVAFAFWRRHPGRVRALILMDTRADADTEPAREKRRALIATVRQEGVGAVVDGMLPGQIGATTRTTDPALVERVAVMLRRAPATGVTGAAQALMDRADSTDTLETISVPTLVIVGDEDTLTPVRDALVMSSAIAGARLVTVPDAGHLAPLEQPAVVNAAIAEFLEVAVRAM